MDCSMSVDHIRYDILAQEALRGVVRTVLAEVAKNGLPGEHHLYISFDTRADGVRLSPRMRAQYPEVMTIVLQHQFWDLTVSQEGFEVGLSFGGIPERLAVPFAAVKGFFDPAVQFGLQFEQTGEAMFKQPTPEADVEPAAERLLLEQEPMERKDIAAASDGVALPRKAGEAAAESASPKESGEVVRLDRFRKK
jgi:uncharacterized protein